MVLNPLKGGPHRNHAISAPQLKPANRSATTLHLLSPLRELRHSVDKLVVIIPLGIACAVLAATGLGLQVAANQLSNLGAPPQYFPGGEPGSASGGLLLDRERRFEQHKVLFRARCNAAAQRLFNWSGASLFVSTICGLLLSFEDLTPFAVGLMIIALAFLIIEMPSALVDWRESIRLEERINNYNRFGSSETNAG